MEQPTALIIEDKPLLAASMAYQLEQVGLSSTRTVGSYQQAAQFLAHHRPALVLVKRALLGNAGRVLNGCPFIEYVIHDGTQFDLPEPAWLKGQPMNFPCSVEHFRKALQTVLA